MNRAGSGNVIRNTCVAMIGVWVGANFIAPKTSLSLSELTEETKPVYVPILMNSTLRSDIVAPIILSTITPTGTMTKKAIITATTTPSPVVKETEPIGTAVPTPTPLVAGLARPNQSAAGCIVRNELDSNDDGRIDICITRYYNDLGLPAKTQLDTNADGAVDSTTEYVYEKDVLRKATIRDDELTIDEEQVWTYDDHGQVILWRIVDRRGNVSSSAYWYNDRHLLVETRSGSSGGSGVREYRYTYYDSDQLETVILDFDADGDSDDVWKYIWTNGLHVSIEHGPPDGGTEIERFEYDALNRVVRRSWFAENDRNPFQEWVYQYNSGHSITRSEWYRKGGLEQTTTYTYDAYGREIASMTVYSVVGTSRTTDEYICP